MALHAFPPLLAWVLWIVWRRRVRYKKAIETQRSEESAQADRTAARDAAKKKHEEELRQRRFACDCRALAIVHLGADANPPLIEEDIPNVDIQTRNPDYSQDDTGVSIMDKLAPAITEALTRLYTACGAGVAFPVFVVPPSEVSGEEVLTQIRTIHTEIVDALQPDIKPGAESLSIRFLPSGDCASNSVISLFEITPDLPGAVILAFDSPHSRAAADQDFLDDEFDPVQLKRQQHIGKPSEAVIALLLTNPELPAMLTAISGVAGETDEQDSMTPFWEKAMLPEGNLATLVRASTALRDDLAQLPVLGRVHRAVFRQSSQSRTGVLDMTRLVQGVLERAQVNAGLIDPPFVFDVAPQDPADETAEKSAAMRCSRIVHNAGGVDVAGKRLAALGSALYYFDIDLNPVDIATATNVVTCIGDIGRAVSVGQLALGLAHAAQQAGPVLCAEFSEGDGIAVSFVMPLTAPA